MDPALTQLAATGAQTIVILMATDAWNGTVHRVAEIFRRSRGPASADPMGELESSRERIIKASFDNQATTIQEEQYRWEAHLRLRLLEDPAVSSLVTELIEAVGVGSNQPMVNLGNVTLRAKATGDARIYQQGYGIQHNE